MKLKNLLWLLLFTSILNACSMDRNTFYVSPSGSDQNPGTKQQPFATIEKAKEAVRILKDENSGKDITVYLRGGEYRIHNTIVFTTEDSGNPGQIITYTSFSGETPVISADVFIQDWEKLTGYPEELPDVAKGNVWVADVSFLREIKNKQAPSPTLAAQMDKTQLFYSLYNGETILQRAKGEYFSLSTKISAEEDDNTIFPFPKGILENWPDITNGELAIIPSRRWISNILPLKDVDVKSGIGHSTVPGTYSISRLSGNVENLMAVLDEPGEWVLDNRTDKLYYWPEDGKPGGKIVVPALTELIRIEGKINYEGATDIPVKNLIFSDLAFTRADRFPWHGKTGWGLQHDWERFDSPSAMMRFRGSENCEVIDCHFLKAGSSGLRFDLYSQNNLIKGNHFEHLGGIGILFAGYGPGTKNVNKNNIVTNNSIHNIGEQYHGSSAIFIWQSGENQITNNIIYELSYAGICATGRIIWDTLGVQECSQTIRWNEVGGFAASRKFRPPEHFYHNVRTWYEREKFLHTRKNLIKRNDIHHVMNVCGDGNFIYVSGAGGGNVVLENYCHESLSEHMNNAIRCDDDQMETLLKRNIICKSGGYAEGFMTKGKNDIIENLVIDLKTTGRHRGYLRFRDGIIDGSVISKNVFYSCEPNQHILYEGIARSGNKAPLLRYTKADSNLYWSCVDPDWGKRHIEEQQKYGIELHSISADPMFVNIEHGNFQFRPESPALKLEISQPVKLEEVGPQGEYRNLFYGK
jgi:hypothetical protein